MGTLVLPKVLTWQQAGSLRDSALKVLKESGAVMVDAAALEKCDSSLVQLLAALEAACRARGQELTFQGGLRQEIRDHFKDLGFSPQDLGRWLE